MEIVEIEISKLKFSSYNPRTITEKEFDGLVKSLEIFGFVDPVVANKDMTIIGGHQRTRAWKQLGNSTVPCLILDLPKKQEKKLNIVLNSHKISGKYDELKLAELLEELKLDDDYNLLNLNDLEPLDLSMDASTEKNDKKQGKLIQCPDCGHEFVL